MSTRLPLLLIHGLIGSLRELVPVLRMHDIESYAPDLLGYGELQSTEFDNIGLHQQVAHLMAWLDDRGLPLVNVLGHSVGGAIAMLLAHTHPERVASIISVEGNVGLADAFWSAGVERMSGGEIEAMMNEFRSDPGAWLRGSGIKPEPDYVAVAERIARKTYRTRNQAREDVFDYIERFYNPTRRHSTLGYLSPTDFEKQAHVA